MIKGAEPHHSLKKAMRWVWGVCAVGILCLVITLVFLLTQTSSRTDLDIRYYGVLIGVNITVVTLLVLTLSIAAYRLVARLRQGRFGSRLLAKLAAIFALLGIFPGLLVYAVSYQFVSRSIEIWFDDKVEGALAAGLNLGKVSFDAQVNDLVGKTLLMADQLLMVSDPTVAKDLLEQARLPLGVDELVLFDFNGGIIAYAGFSGYQLIPQRLTREQIDKLREGEGVVHAIEDAEDGSIPKMTATVVVPSSALGVTSAPRFTGNLRFLRITARIPSVLAANAFSVQEVYQEYQERALGRAGLRNMYIGTLTLALMLAIFGAVIIAVLLGQQLVRPLLVLADGVKQVGEGDLSPKQLVNTRDELGGLTKAFADMTNQLRDAQNVAHKSLKQVAAARAHLQTILDNLTAGVIVIDKNEIVQSLNPGAQRILHNRLQPIIGQRLVDNKMLRAFGQQVSEQFAALPKEEGAHWQNTFELDDVEGEDIITIVARGAWLSQTMQLVVIDDISDIISAQRSVAWGEVARRLAHEIKNPLTPIQLAAERIEYKFSPKLDDSDRAVLERSVKMIVDQVDAMKRLVNEFRDYARLPIADLKPLDLNAQVHDIIQLYISAQQQTPQLHFNVELASELPLVRGDASQLRQVLHNLLQNALDAVEGQPEQNITITTTLEHNSLTARDNVNLCIKDNGSGFPDKILKRAFEPYITTKEKGTGLGLPVVKKIVYDHHARINLSNICDEQGDVVGAQVCLSFPVS